MFSWSTFTSCWPFLVTIYLYFTYKWIVSPFDYFSKRNIPHSEWVPFFGSIKDLFFKADSFSGMILKQYAKYKDYKFFGFYVMRDPIMIVKDLDLIRQITVEKFDHFTDHRFIFNKNTDPILAEMIQMMQNEKWKSLRETLMPAFTPEKIRLMFYLVDEYCEIMVKHINDKIELNGSLELDTKDIFTRFSNDVIAAIVFGIKVDSLSDPNNELFRQGEKAVKFTEYTMLKFLIYGSFHKLMSMFRITWFSHKFTTYFKTLVLDTIKYRSENDIRRFDMIQLLVDSSRDYYQKNSEEKYPEFFSKNFNLKNQKNWSDNEIVGQCLSIFIGGFTYMSHLLSYVTIELTRNLEIQVRLQNEIDQMKVELNGKSASYEVLNSMKYLDMVICEALRKHPASFIIDRVCTKPYTITDDSTGHSINLKPGDGIWIPIQALHFDPEYFPDPNKFDPERFINGNRGYIKPYSYIPFSAGPRNCFCSKFALIQCKALLFHLLSKYSFEEATTIDPAKLDMTGFIFGPQLNYRIKLNLRN